MTKNRAEQQQRLSDLPDKLQDHHPPDARPSPAGRRLRNERERQSAVEQSIQEAMSNGEFDNLPGAGKPFRFNKNPYLEPGQEWAFGLLQRNGFAPEWIERNKTIRRNLDAARRQLKSAWEYRANNPHDETLWQQAISRFTQRLEKLNLEIDAYNLMAPTLPTHRRRIKLEDELRRLEATE